LWQWLVFLLSSLFFLLLWRFWLRKYFQREVVEKDRDATVSGQVGVVSKDITPEAPGEVELAVPLYGLKRWMAEAAESIPTGAQVRVVEARGIRLFVQKTE
jgi:membrane protein implicated in regulation of membrane protease activity